MRFPRKQVNCEKFADAAKSGARSRPPDIIDLTYRSDVERNKIVRSRRLVRAHIWSTTVNPREAGAALVCGEVEGVASGVDADAAWQQGLRARRCTYTVECQRSQHRIGAEEGAGPCRDDVARR